MVPDQTQLRSKTFLIRPKCARRGYDQTQLRSKSPLIRQKCARRGYDQTQLRSKLALIRPKCARIRLWSDFSDQIDVWSDHLQTIVQTVLRSNFLPDPVILAWEHTGVRSTGSDHKPILVWTSTWVGPCYEIHVWFCAWKVFNSTGYVTRYVPTHLYSLSSLQSICDATSN